MTVSQVAQPFYFAMVPSPAHGLPKRLAYVSVQTLENAEVKCMGLSYERTVSGCARSEHDSAVCAGQRHADWR